MKPARVRGVALVLLCVPALAGLACRREAPPAAAPGSIAVTATVEPAEIRVGDLARLTVTVDHPAAGSLSLPEFEQGKKIVVRERTEGTVPLAGGLARTTAALLITSFEPGEHPVATGKVRFAGAGGQVLEQSFPATSLRTKSSLAGESTPLREIKELARWPAPILWWAALAAGVLLLAAALFFGLRRWRSRRREEPAPGPPPAPAHETALRALAALRERRLIEQHQVEPFYLELSAIVRRYIEERFGVRAPERTTEEFIREASGSGFLAPGHQGLVREFLEQSDLVKFARHRPVPEDMLQAFAAAERLVRETMPTMSSAPVPAEAAVR